MSLRSSSWVRVVVYGRITAIRKWPVAALCHDFLSFPARHAGTEKSCGAEAKSIFAREEMLMRPAFCSEVNSVSSASVHTFTGCVIGCRHAAGLNGLPLARFAAALSHPPAPRSRGSLLAPERSMLAFLHRARPLIGLSAIGVLIAVPGWQPAKRKDANPTYRRSSSSGPNRDVRCGAPGTEGDQQETASQTL
jgi:hypothetical protein